MYHPEGVVVAVLMIVGGLGVTAFASRSAIDHAEHIIAATRLSPFVVGMLLLAIGTDLPEIANSIAASLSGHGDINAGDSIGSAFTQSTLIMGLLPILGGVFLVSRSESGFVGGATVMALLFGALLMSDGYISRLDGVLFISFWIVSGWIAWAWVPSATLPTAPTSDGRSRPRDWALTLVALAGVGLGAWVAVQGLVQLSETVGLPEYIVGFLIAAIGTSLPELVVNTTALRRGHATMAVGGLLGASLLDATVSIGAGPLLAPVAVTSSIAVPASLWAAAGLALATLLLALRRRHDLWSAGGLLLIYAALVPVLLSL